MNPPFSITIEITEARQCHAAVSQLLRIFPSLRLTITANETIPASSGSSQTDILDAHIRAYVAACIASIYPRADPRRFREAIEAACAGRLDSDSNSEGTRTEADIDSADGWAKFRASEAERKAASRAASKHAADEALRKAEGDRGNNHADPTHQCKFESLEGGS